MLGYGRAAPERANDLAYEEQCEYHENRHQNQVGDALVSSSLFSQEGGIRGGYVLGSRRPPSTAPLESLLQVFQDIVDVLKSHGEPDKPGKDAGMLALLIGKRAVRRAGRVSGDRADIAQIGRQRARLEGIDEALPTLQPALDDERNNSSAQFHLPARQFDLRMAGMMGISDRFHFLVVGEIIFNGCSVFAMPLHAHGERFEASAQRPCVERRKSRAGMPRKGADLVDEAPYPDNDAAHRTSLTVDILRRRVHHQIGAESHGLLEGRRCEYVIDEQNDIPRATESRQLLQVDQIQRRVRGRLDENDSRIGSKSGFPRADIRRNRIRVLDSPSRKNPLKDLMGGSEQGAGCEDVVTAVR